MKDNRQNLDMIATGAIILNGAGAVRSHGSMVYAWISRMQYVNDAGVVYENGLTTNIRVSANAPVYIENEISGKLLNGSRSSDGHYVVTCHVDNVPDWIERNDCGYAIAEYEPKTLKCSTCGVIHKKHSTPCDCIQRSSALIINEIQVSGLRIYKRRCDNYIQDERMRLLNWIFEPVLPTTPSFISECNDARN